MNAADGISYLKTVVLNYLHNK